jgi:excisionase family DNA binding protein
MAQKITTQYCCHNCARKANKLKVRQQNIELAQIKNNMQQVKAKEVITEDQIKVIQAKEYLTLKEAAILLNVSPLTLRRWTLLGKVKSNKVGKKHLFNKEILIS